MTRTRTALVIGGGVAGPATAMALHKAGIDATVYEAHPSAADGIGSFLTLASNGIEALRVLGADGAAIADGFPTPTIRLRSASGKDLGTSRTGSTLPDRTPSHTIRRADLYRALHDEATSRGIRIEHGRRLVAAEQGADGVRAHFADGTQAEADVLVGADGVRSTVRRIIDPGAPAPTYVGLLTNGGYAAGVDVDLEPGGFEMVFGRRAFFGYASAPDGAVWWFANVPHRDEPAPAELAALGGERGRQRLLELYAGDAGPAVRVVEATPELSPMWPIHAVPHLPHWHRGRMVVVGDAAHAPSPTSGQGASLAAEDAVVLATCLRDEPDPQVALARFEAARRPRVERIVKAAARINDSKAAGPVGRVVRDAVLPVVLRLTRDSRAVRGTVDHRVEWPEPVSGGAGRLSTGPA